MPINVASIVTFIKQRGKADDSPNSRGNTVYRLHMPDERYIVDFAPDFKAEGWEQFDTNQDAHYFGVWVNRSQRLTLTYGEGDWTLVECPTAESYIAEIRDAIAFYGEGRIASCHGADGSVVVCQDRERFITGEPQIGAAEVLAIALGGAS